MVVGMTASICLLNKVTVAKGDPSNPLTRIGHRGYPCDWLSVMIWSVRSAPVAKVVVLRILVLFD